MISREMVAAIDEEIQRLQLIRSLLLEEGSVKPTPAKRGRKPSAAKQAAKSTRTKRTLSPEARERIAAAQRKRWAASKRAARKTAK